MATIRNLAPLRPPYLPDPTLREHSQEWRYTECR
jgi:hypothetical protein